MSDVAIPTAEEILRLCEEAGPGPWYPSEYVQGTNVSRDALEEPLAQLRVAGLIQLTEWVSGKGQGYILTGLGREVLASPRLLDRLRRGVPGFSKTPPSEAPVDDLTARGTTWDRGEAVRASLMYRIKPRVVPVLMGLNILVFAIGLVLADRQNIPLNDVLRGRSGRILDQTGAIHGLHLLDGQWWRLLTSCFVHVGVFHLIVNMFSLYLLGPLAEQVWGRWRFVTIYVLAGLGGSWAAMVYSPMIPVAGASGAIWGVMASILAWILLNRAYLPPQLVKSLMWQLGIVLLINVYISFQPGISSEGHFGGGSVGFIAASLLNVHRFGTPNKRVATMLLLVFLPIAMLMSLQQAMKTDPNWVELKQGQRVRDDLEAKQEAVAEAVTPVQQVYETVEELNDDRLVPLVNTPPAEWDAMEVEATLRRIEQLQQRLDEELARFEEVLEPGFEAADAVDEVRIILASYLINERQYLEAVAIRLREGADWTDEATLRAVTRKRGELVQELKILGK